MATAQSPDRANTYPQTPIPPPFNCRDEIEYVGLFRVFPAFSPTLTPTSAQSHSQSHSHPFPVLPLPTRPSPPLFRSLLVSPAAACISTHRLRSDLSVFGAICQVQRCISSSRQSTYPSYIDRRKKQILSGCYYYHYRDSNLSLSSWQSPER